MILCDYCSDPIDTTVREGAERRISGSMNRPPEPPTETIDLHARCVDPWVTAAKQIHKPPQEA